MAGQDTISCPVLCPAQEAWGMSTERPGRVGTDGTRRGRTDGAWWRRPDRTGWRVSDGVGLGEYVTVVVLFGWARGTRRQLGRFERVDHVHLRQDWRRRDEIELPLLRERLHFGRIKFGELRLWQVIHNPGTEWVANDIDGGTHSVTEWTNGISVSEITAYWYQHYAKCQHPNVDCRAVICYCLLIRHLTHSSQSTAISRLMSWVGRPTAVRISSMVTSPALGILAAPTLASVAVILERRDGKKVYLNHACSNVL